MVRIYFAGMNGARLAAVLEGEDVLISYADIVRRHLRVELRLEHFELLVQEFGKTFGRVLLKQQTTVLLEFVTEPK